MIRLLVEWLLNALALLIVFKGVAYSVSLGSFRGGPTFPAIFLGAAALPGVAGRGADRRRVGGRFPTDHRQGLQ